MNIIAPTYLKNLWMEEQLEKTDALCGITVSPLNATLFRDIETIQPIIYTYQASAILNSISNELQVYGGMLKYPAFLQEVLDFARECALYNIPASSLPTDTPQRQDLCRMIEALSVIEFPESQRSRKTVDPNEYQWMETYYASAFERRIYEQVNAANIIPLAKAEPKTMELRTILNARQEIEAVAQYICENGIDRDSIVVLSDPDQINLVEQVFNRYHIPFGALEHKRSSRAATVIRYLLDFYVDKSLDAFMRCLVVNAFEADDSIIAFISTVIVTPMQLLEHFEMPAIDHLEDAKRKDWQTPIDNFNAFVDRYHDLLELMLEPCDASFIPHLYKHVLSLKIPEDKAIKQMRGILEQSMAFLKTPMDFQILGTFFGTDSLVLCDIRKDFCAITDLTHPLPARKYTFVLGCTSKNYPGFPTRTGLFDEAYVEKVEGYPTLDERYSAYTKAIEWVKHSASEQLIYSAHHAGYDGKAFEIAFEVEEMFPSYSPWKLIDNDPVYYPEHYLSPKTAEQLFFSADTLHGSITGFEKYFNCPYQYFLSRGLYVDENQEIGMQANVAGTIQHAIMEEAVNTYGKDYAAMDEQFIRSITTPYFSELKGLNPKYPQFFDLVEEKMIRNLLTSLQALRLVEEDSGYIPYKTEYKYSETFPLGGRELEIHGFIDRIDVHDDRFRIIDYKSSVHSLVEDKVKAGVQLQLCTYLMVARRFLNMEPAGAYYWSMKNDNITDAAVEEKLDKKFLDKHRLDGVTVSDDIGLDYSQTHLSGKYASYEQLEQCMMELYEFLIHSLEGGNIQLKPVEDACTFCKYGSICRFRGEQQKPAPLVMAEDTLFSKKGKED